MFHSKLSVSLLAFCCSFLLSNSLSGYYVRFDPIIKYFKMREQEICDNHCLPSDIILLLLLLLMVLVMMVMMRVKGKHILNMLVRRSEWRKRVTNTTETYIQKKEWKWKWNMRMSRRFLSFDALILCLNVNCITAKNTCVSLFCCRFTWADFVFWLAYSCT